jgi:hypothetical protein
MPLDEATLSSFNHNIERLEVAHIIGCQKAILLTQASPYAGIAAPFMTLASSKQKNSTRFVIIYKP